MELALGGELKSRIEDEAGLQMEIRSRLMKAGGRAFVKEEFVSEAEARELIEELGGMPCYPVLADGAGKRCEFEETPEMLVEELGKRGIGLVEFIPARNEAEVLEEYVRVLRGAGIAASAGTEHNTPGWKRLEVRSKGDAELSEEMKGIFREGAQLIAEHQGPKRI